MNTEKKYKLISLVGVVCFPQMPITCDIRREISKNSILEALNIGEQVVFFTHTKNNLSPNVLDSINIVGCLANVLSADDDSEVLKVQAEGIKRVKITDIVSGEPYLTCTIEDVKTSYVPSTSLNLLMSTAKQNFVEYASYEKKFNPELMRLIDSMTEPNNFVDAVTVLSVKEELKQLEILNEFDVQERLEKLISFLVEEIEIERVNIELSKKVQKNMDKNQKEYYLREQMKVISKELGDDDVSEFDEIESKIKEGKIPDEVKQKALKELARLKKLPDASPDYSVLRNYLDTLLELPWGIKTVDSKDLIKARKILDEDHSGLDKVKD